MDIINEYRGLILALTTVVALAQFVSPNNPPGEQPNSKTAELSLPAHQSVPMTMTAVGQPEAPKEALLTLFSSSPTSCFDPFSGQSLFVATSCPSGLSATYCTLEPNGTETYPTTCPLQTNKVPTICPGPTTTPTNCSDMVVSTYCQSTKVTPTWCPIGSQLIPTNCPTWVLATRCSTGNHPTLCPPTPLATSSCNSVAPSSTNPSIPEDHRSAMGNLIPKTD